MLNTLALVLVHSQLWAICASWRRFQHLRCLSPVWEFLARTAAAVPVHPPDWLARKVAAVPVHLLLLQRLQMQKEQLLQLLLHFLYLTSASCSLNSFTWNWPTISSLVALGVSASSRIVYFMHSVLWYLSKRVKTLHIVSPSLKTADISNQFDTKCHCSMSLTCSDAGTCFMIYERWSYSKMAEF